MGREMAGSPSPVLHPLQERRPAAVPGSKPAESDSGLMALALVARILRTNVNPRALAHELGLTGKPIDGADMVRAAELARFRARLLTSQTQDRLARVPTPVIIRNVAGRYFVLNRLVGGGYALRDPAEQQPRRMGIAQVCSDWSGEIIQISRQLHPESDIPEFGLAWFWSALLKYRKPIMHVMIASFFIQLIALATPLFFQVIVDKVLVNKSQSTLTVVVIGMVVVEVFGSILQYLRAYALTHTSSRVDTELGVKVFERLFKLPLSYFESRATGQTVARIREIETIRSFLTGQGLTAILDVVFSLVFIVFLFIYSETLTIVVVLSLAVYVLIAAVIRPPLRRKIKERFLSGARSQQFLVESVVGAPTLKAAAVEPLVQQQWEERLVNYVRISLQVSMLGAIGQNLIQLTTQLTTTIILYFGAFAVIDGQMSVGELIAFNMIARQLSTPIMRLSQLWQDVQQIQISVERLGDIFRVQPELGTESVALFPKTKIRGAVALKNVSFRYHADAPDVLADISLEIPPGQAIGIVGPSGSGKSTLAKLIQRLHLPTRGAVLIDGVDVTQVHPAWFRKQIGVVLQENLLFNRTIHENIALTTPAMSREVVMGLAKLAGAHEFIRQLPRGYDTYVEEWGANLSGGQRQRIAIARALARNPRILIFDEATSALDYETEQIIQANMRQIVKGRTVIIIAHRLPAIRVCDRIIGMEQGRIVQDGSHAELIRQEGFYARLCSLQGLTELAE
jgi:ATP-binding cassette, subfamily B, bacterial HlyB/CyaB